MIYLPLLVFRHVKPTFAMSETMKAWQYVSPGGTISTHIALATTSKPLPSSLKGSDILVKVAAAAINPADYKFPQIGFLSRTILCYPMKLGMDGSGTVSAVGPDADVAIGDHVTFHIDLRDSTAGALSEYIVAKKEGYAHISRTTDLIQAASLGTAALTAYQTIQPNVERGDSVFINGGAGGVGTFAIQMGKILGCYVTTTCSGAKAEILKGLGADEVIDYRTQDVVETLKSSGRKYNLVLDRLIDYGQECGEGAVFAEMVGGGARHRVQTYLTYNSREDLAQIAAWLDEGKLRGVIDKVFEFGDVVEAFEYLKTGRTTGKIVIHVP
ncbi:reticulon-4-interacting protein 1 [Penicillium cataractarum]|uniref:Reticulon-4-interacting protein 1 n=1 Tax=Penicillium cataractarum TaxID=2100454 RepID=A0A9X0B6C1_9EURO|nr:reticulon-4-interacting protein 1 [Penicillium cataractarum]KAJ5389778.1 reticulon-4-interacting protein 1 [Penicillium cataractarum]